MRKLWLAALLVVIALPVLTQASVITFGGTSLCGDTCAGTQVPDGYGNSNFTWGGSFYAYGNIPYDANYGNTYGAPSGAFAYNAFGDSPITLNSSVAFTFNGADFSTFAQNNQFQTFSSTTIEIQGYNGSTLVGTVVANLSSTSFNFVTADFANVTSLVFTNDCGSCSGRWWLMDDFTYNQGGTTPEPGTMVMFGSGLLVAAGAIRRRFRS
jgi:hypothetical protein